MIKTLKHLRFMLVMLLATLGVNVAFGATATFSASDLSTNPKTKDGITCTMATSVTVGNQQIWKNGSSAVKADVIQIANSANQTYTTYYFEITSANEITGVTFKAVNNQSGSNYSIPVVYWTGAVAAAFQGYEMVSLAPKDAAVEPAAQSLTIPSGTKTIRFYRTIRTNAAYTEFSNASGYKTLGDGKTAYIISLEVTTATAATPHTVTYNANGGTCAKENDTEASAGAGVTLPSATPADEATQEFLGWAVSSTETDPAKIFAAGTKYEPAADITLYAIYGAKTVKSAIVYANTKTASTAALPTLYTEGVGIAEFPALEDVTGFHFTGWNPSSISAEATGEQTITAEWEVVVAPYFVMNYTKPSDGKVESIACTNGSVADANATAKALSLETNDIKFGGNDCRLLVTLTDATIVEGTKIEVSWISLYSDGTKTGIAILNENNANQTMDVTGIGGTSKTETGTESYTFTAATAANYSDQFIITRNGTGKSLGLTSIKVYNVGPAIAKHHVTYAKGDVAVTGTVPTQADVKENGTFTVAGKGDLAWTGHTFTGWNDGAADYAAGATYTMGTADVTLTAQWDEINCSAFQVTCTNGQLDPFEEWLEYTRDQNATADIWAFNLVAVTGGTVATYEWYRNTVDAHEGENLVRWNQDTDPSYTSQYSKLPDVSTPGVYYYFCKVTSTDGCVAYSKTITYTVNAVASSKKQLTRVEFSNNFDAFVKEGDHSVTAYYMGETAPTVVADSWVVSEKATAAVVDNKIVVTAEDGTTQDYAITLTQVTPCTTYGEDITLVDNMGWVVGGGYNGASGKEYYAANKSCDEATNMRIAEGKNRINFFVGACDSISLKVAASRDIKVYRNGVQLTGINNSGAKDATLTIPGDIAAPSMITLVNNTGCSAGDVAFKTINIKEYIKSDDATLSNLTVNGVTVEGFDAATLTYDVELPYGTVDVPTVAGIANDAKAKSVVVTAATELPGATTVVVTAENDDTKTYTINFTVLTTNYVAKIGETKFETLAAAIAAVPTDGAATTITLLDNVELTATVATTYGQNIVLNLNGKNISSTVLAIKNLGDLNITGTGNITVGGTTKTAYGINNAGAAGKKANLVIGENVSVSAPCVAVYTSYGKTIVNGTLANTQADASNIYSTLRLGQTSSEVVVAATASVTGQVNAVYGDKGTLEVNSTNVGKIYADGSAISGLKIKKTTAIESLNVYGHAEFSDVADYYVAAKAISACTGTVKLLSDINAALALSAGKTVTLDLNGHRVAAETYPIKVEGNLTIKGEGTVQSTGMGSATAVQAAAYVLKDGKLIIESGNFKAGYEGLEGNPAVYIRDNAQVAIKGGDFVGGSKMLLNILDAYRATASFSVTGGTFHGFNPEDNTAEGEHTNFCAQNYGAIANGDGSYTVVRLYTFSKWDGESINFEKKNAADELKFTVYSTNTGGRQNGSTALLKAQQIDRTDATLKANVLSAQQFVIKFAKDVKQVKLYAYNGNTGRALSSVKVTDADNIDATPSWSDAGFTLTSNTLATNYDYEYIIDGHFEAGKFYFIQLSGKVNFFDIFYTEAEVVNTERAITAVEIGGEALDATELAAFVANKGMTLPKTDAAFAVKATETVKDIYDDSFEKVVATNEFNETAVLDGDNFVATLVINAETYTVTAPKMADPVAKIGTTVYETLAEAVAAAQDGDEIIMLADVDLTARIEIAGKAIALDLAGHLINYTGASLGSGVLLVHNGAGLAINDSSDPDAGQIVANAAYAAVALTKAGDDATNAAVLVVNGGTLTGKYYAVVGNGSRPNTEITINGGTLTAVEPGDAVGIYHPQCGTLTINGGTIVAETGIAIKAGVLTITGGTIHATGANGTPTEAFGNGVNVSGAAIQIESNNSYGVACDGEVELHITDGTIISDNAPAIYEYVANASTETHMTNSNIIGGIINGAQPVYVSAGVEGFIAGGIFNQAVPAAACAPGFEPKDNGDGTYGVKVAENVVPISEKTVWDWNGLVSETIAMPAGNDYILLAAAEGLPVDFKATSLASKKGSTHYAFRSTTYQCWQGGAIKFETTVPGIVTYTVVNPSKGTTINFDLNGEHVYAITAPSGSASSKQTISQLVPAGEVVLALEEAGKDMRVYKIEFEPTTTIRNTTAGKLVTMCQAKSVAKLDGAVAYEVEKKNAIGIDLVEAEFPLVAGKPYILEATKAQINAVLVGEAVEEVVAANGLVGNLSTAGGNMSLPNGEGYYIFLNNHICAASGSNGNYVAPDRAYLNMNAVGEINAAPGRRRITMTTNETNGTTGLEMFEATEDAQKIMLNGQLYIIRGGKAFNAAGQLVK